MSKKRKCIFTGKEADCSVSVGQDKHNWAKKVPCTKKWCEMFLGKPLDSTQIKLVELFYEQEVARIKVDNIEAQMDEIRANIACPVVKEHKKRTEKAFFYVDEPKEGFDHEVYREAEKALDKYKKESFILPPPRYPVKVEVDDGQYDIGDSEDLSWMEDKKEEISESKSLAEKAMDNVEKILNKSTKPNKELGDAVRNLEEIVNKENKDFWE